MLSLMK